MLNKKILLALIFCLGAPFIQAKQDEQSNQNPIAVISHDPGFCSILHTWGFIGDSLSSGEFESLDNNGKKGYHDRFEYSWGQCMCRAMGVHGDNYSQGGETAQGWIKHFWDNPQNRNKDIDARTSPKQAYIIALGVNDEHKEFPVGDFKSDVNLKNYLDNADTFIGCYAGIIQRVRSISPDCKIFLVTVPSNKKGQDRPYNKAIRQFAGIFQNVYILDIQKYGPDYEDNNFKERYYVGGHLNAMGYQFTALMFMTYINWIIEHNPKDFRQAGFIGTQWKYGE